MPKVVVQGAQLKCDQGTAPASLTILPVKLTEALTKPIATVLDFVPTVNIAPFGMCRTQANPQVAAATAAAQGVLTPQPCLPVTTAPWSPGAKVATVREDKVLTDDSKCKCAWTGTIEITDPGSEVEVES
jgi:hypothetical protein